MKSSNCKTKGKLFEEKVAHILHTTFMNNDISYKTLFLEVGNDSLKVKRDSSSGTFKDSDGDISLGILKRTFPVAVECKHHKNMNFTLNSLLSKKVSYLYNSYNTQAKVNADRNKLTPLVVFKANYTDIFVFFKLLDYSIKEDSLNINKIVFDDGFVIILFEDFLQLYLDGTITC